MLNKTFTENSHEKSMINQEMNTSTEESLPTFEFEDVKIFGEFSENEVPFLNQICWQWMHINIYYFQVRIDTSMFYFVSNGAKTLEYYQICIIESAARLHSSTRIFVIFLTKDIDDILQSKLMTFLVGFDNIYFRYVLPTE